MNVKRQTFKYILLDYFSAAASWILMYLHFLQSFALNISSEIKHSQFIIAGLTVIPLYWLIIYYISGYYREVYLKSRLTEFWQTIGNILIGVIILFLFAINKMQAGIPGNKVFFSYLLIHFTVTYIPRLILTTHTTRLIHKGLIGVNTIIIGSGNKALRIYREIISQKRSSGNRFSGFVHADEPRMNKSSFNSMKDNIMRGPDDLINKNLSEERINEVMKENLKFLGTLDMLGEIINQNNIREVIIATESSEKSRVIKIINKLAGFNVVIKAIPSMSDIVTGRIRMNSILGTPLLLVSHQHMPAWQENIKYMLDFAVALTALIITLPLTLFLAAGIKLTSRGPVFYSHERIGRYGKPFRIYKFRSMYNDAEKNGPELSSKNDERITPFGRFMRKAKLDEIPNFINVIKGDMSLVGPRPERKYFIDMIMEKEPHYQHLLKIRPGITSWGQVKYGYAENIEQMLDRLKYDLIYLDNMSLVVDIKILIYTALTIMRRKGI